MTVLTNMTYIPNPVNINKWIKDTLNDKLIWEGNFFDIIVNIFDMRYTSSKVGLLEASIIPLIRCIRNHITFFDIMSDALLWLVFYVKTTSPQAVYHNVSILFFVRPH